jgi:uncharacterized protein YoxC
MSDEAFRWVIATGVTLCSVAFIIMAVTAFAVYKFIRSLMESARKIMEENKPRIGEITAHTAETTKTIKQQTQRLGLLLNDVADRAQHRVAQLDYKVEQTVDQIEEVGDSVKDAVLKPVREVNGILNGVRAAISTYAQGSRRPIERATQDEEMFI